MDENSPYRYSLDESQRLLSECHINNTPNLTSDSNQQYNPMPDPFIRNDNSNQQGYDLTSHAALNYIEKILLEEDIDGNCGTYEEAALHATEKTFYDELGQEYPSLSGKTPLVSPEYVQILGDGSNSSSGQSSNGSNFSRSIDCRPLNQLNHNCYVVQENEFTFQFNKGVEEALKFVPKFDKLFLSSESTFGAPASLEPQKSSNFGAKISFNDRHWDAIEGRDQKQKAISSDDLVRNEKMDKVLLRRGKKYIEDVITIREIFEKEMKDESQNILLENLNTTKTRSKKQLDEDLVDLRSLLMSCAKAVFANDQITANELIKQIRKHSSPNGDWSQRVAFYFVDGLEARLAGTGSEVYRKLSSKRMTVSNMLKAYHFYLAVCPYRKAAFYFSNQTIFNLLKNKSHIHIVDFGIQFGFQWPSFFERFSKWKDTPPKICITGIDTPQLGFRPSEIVNGTGKRLAEYAQSFNIPFEYKGIASKWANIRIEDLDVSKNELLVVNCIHSENLTDESTSKDSSKDDFLKTIKNLNPHMFILVIVNSSSNGPYFVGRFREILFHFSSMFDMFDTTMPRNNRERFVMERHLGQRALNAIACEGSERVVRPEPYKHWQARSTRVGLAQIPVDPKIVKKVNDVVKSLYHKEFVVDEDNGWLLMGWKGRIMFAMSTWNTSEV